MAEASSLAEEPRQVAAARGGDRGAFEALVASHRGELHAHCYRMLGSIHDADDALQDALFSAWRGIAGFRGRGSFRAWLFQIATNASLKLIARRPKRVLPMDVVDQGAGQGQTEGTAEPLWLEPYPDEVISIPDGFAAPDARYEQRESIEIAFVAAVQHLSARQRAVLLLRDVLGFSAKEVADSLETTVPSVNSVLTRARRAILNRVPEQSQQRTLRSLGDARQKEIVERYMSAWERGDVSAMVALLTRDASWNMPPQIRWFHGIDDIVGGFLEKSISLGWRHIPVRSNGQLAVACYLWDARVRIYRARVFDVLTFRGDRIQAVTSFIDAALFSRFALAAELPLA